jgi:hypothetical protein
MRSSSRNRPQVRPRLETLEGRECPAATRAYPVVARTGDLATTALGAAPSISDTGLVTFTATFATGQGILARPFDHGTLTNITPGFQSSSRTFSQSVEANAAGQVVAVDRTNLSGQTVWLLRLWDAAHPGTFTVLSRASSPRIPQDNDFDAIFYGVGVDAGGDAAFVGLDNNLSVDQSVVLTRNQGGANHTVANLPAPQTLRPQIADTGDIVVRAGTQATDPIILYPAAGGSVTIADSSAFAALGQSPGLGSDGRVVAFYGDLTAAGAAAINAAQPTFPALAAGPGVFLSVGTASHGRVIVRAAGPGAGATDVATFDANTRVGVNRVGTGAAGVAVVFMGQDAGGHDGVYETRVGFTAGPADPTGFQPAAPKLLAQAGDSIAGVSGAVQAISIYDPVNAKGDVAFWVNTGGSADAVVVAPAAGSDIRVVDATTTDFEHIKVKYAIDGTNVQPDFKFKVYASGTPTFDPAQQNVAIGEYLIDTKKAKAVGDKHAITIDLASAAPPQRDTRQYLIVVADADEQVTETDESAAQPMGDNNSSFVIPLLTAGHAGFDKLTGQYAKGLAEDRANDPIRGRMAQGTADFTNSSDLTATWAGAGRTFKDEEPNPYLGDDHLGDPAVVGPLGTLASLIDLAVKNKELTVPPTGLMITEAFDEQGEHSKNSRHYEGRAVDIGATGDALHRLLGLGLLAGFSWANAEGNHAHFSVIGRSAEVSVAALSGALSSARSRQLITSADRFTLLNSDLATAQQLTDQINGGALPPDQLAAAKTQRIAVMKQFVTDVKKGVALGQIVVKLPSALAGQPKQDAKIGDLLIYNADKLLATY